MLTDTKQPQSQVEFTSKGITVNWMIVFVAVVSFMTGGGSNTILSRLIPQPVAVTSNPGLDIQLKELNTTVRDLQLAVERLNVEVKNLKERKGVIVPG